MLDNNSTIDFNLLLHSTLWHDRMRFFLQFKHQCSHWVLLFRRLPLKLCVLSCLPFYKPSKNTQSHTYTHITLLFPVFNNKTGPPVAKDGGATKLVCLRVRSLHIVFLSYAFSLCVELIFSNWVYTYCHNSHGLCTWFLFFKKI